MNRYSKNIPTNKTGVIVLGGHIQGLGIMRIFGRDGMPVILIDNTGKNLARHSRYCTSFFNINDDQLLNFLLDLGKKKQYNNWLIYPTNDFHVQLLSKNKNKLESNFIISSDSWDNIELFYNKRYTYEFAEKIKIPIANTFFPESEEDLDSIDINFPCIIKPAIMHQFYSRTKKKVFVCRDMEELKFNYRKAVKIVSKDEIIVQEIIKGPSKNQFSAGFLFLNGKTYVYLIACRMRQHPLDFGNSTTYAETMDIPILREYGEKILQASNYNGICEIEFKLDERDNKYKLLEVNTRTWKWHTIANKANTPFLKLSYDYLTGKQIKPVKTYQRASFYHSITDIPIQFKLLLLGYKYWNRKVTPVEHAVFTMDDIKPWIFEKIYLPLFILNR